MGTGGVPLKGVLPGWCSQVAWIPGQRGQRKLQLVNESSQPFTRERIRSSAWKYSDFSQEPNHVDCCFSPAMGQWTSLLTSLLLGSSTIYWRYFLFLFKVGLAQIALCNVYKHIEPSAQFIITTPWMPTIFYCHYNWAPCLIEGQIMGVLSWCRIWPQGLYLLDKSM